jgi:alpha-beta hydrolase superfamily lysophospholipase
MHTVLITLASVLLLGVAYLFLRGLLYFLAERILFFRKRNGDETPADVGIPFKAFTIPSGSRRLAAWYVPADPANDAHKAVLIYHGVYECLSEWVPALHFFWKHGISTMIFDYTGYGDSPGWGTLYRLRQDVQSAWTVFRSESDPDVERYALGLSLGSGCLLDGLSHFQDELDGIFLVAAFTSLRDAAASIVHAPVWLLALLIPDAFENRDRIRQVRKPVMIVHSRDDELLSVSMAERLYAAAQEPKKLVLLDGLKHNDTLEGRAPEYLTPLVDELMNPRLKGTL